MGIFKNYSKTKVNHFSRYVLCMIGEHPFDFLLCFWTRNWLFI